MTSYSRFYIRASTTEQSAGLEAQRAAIQLHYDHYLKPKGFEFGGWYEDVNVRGKIPLADRPAGKRLAGDLECGDVAVFSKLDRGFRNLTDLCQVVDGWHKRGVLFNLLDLGVDTSTAVGMLLVKMLGAIAEFEVVRRSERVKEANAVRETLGLPTNSMWFHGFRWKYRALDHQRGGRRIVVVLAPKDAEFDRAFHDWWHAGWSYDAIARHMLYSRTTTWNGLEWDANKIYKSIKRHKKWLKVLAESREPGATFVCSTDPPRRRAVPRLEGPAPPNSRCRTAPPGEPGCNGCSTAPGNDAPSRNP